MLKTQIMTMFMMKSTAKPGEGGDIYMILYSMLMLNMVEWLFRNLPGLAEQAKAWVIQRYSQKKDVWKPLIDAHKKEREVINSITMTRIFKEGEKPSDRVDNVVVEKIDAVLDYITNLDNARHVRMDTRISLNNAEELELTPLLKAKIKQTGSGSDASTEMILYSTVLKICDIRAWIDEVHANFVSEKNNKLGNKVFYFNEIASEPVVMTDMSVEGKPKQVYRWDNMPKMLTFNMNEFKTSKSFSNVYGHHVDELKERLNLFVDHPEWYLDRGIPHSLGIMLYGVPGAGKTSTIKAIAKDTNRHIFNLSLRPYTTQKQLTNLFFNETVHIQSYDGGKQTYKIPLNKRVYVIEDIDCLTDVVLDRNIHPQSEQSGKEGESLTLSFLLNLLDGVLETPGRILVITSNYPEKLDKAFVRPGRIDVKIEFKHADREFLLDMFNKFYTLALKPTDIPDDLVDQFTPAEIMESMCYHFKSYAHALEHLAKKLSTKKAKEEEMATGTKLAELGFATEEAVLTAPTSTPVAAPSLPAEEHPPRLELREELHEETEPEPEPKDTKPTEEEPKKTEDAPPTKLCDMCQKLYPDTPEAAKEHDFAICLRTPPKLVASPPSFRKLAKPKEWRAYGSSWKCEIDHEEKMSAFCSVCSVKRREAESRQFGMGMNGGGFGAGLPMVGGTEDAWGSASFGDAVIPEGAGGWMPGQGGDVRSDVDLNLAAGR